MYSFVDKISSYDYRRKNSIGRLQDVVEREHGQYMENKKQYDEIKKQVFIAFKVLLY